VGGYEHYHSFYILKIVPEQIRSFRELRVYQEAFGLQQEIFKISKKWPVEERYALTGQVRRSARSIGANISESWAKRSYPAHFTSKLTDADAELQETSHWISTAFACEYLTESLHSSLQIRIQEIGKGLGKMISMPEKFKPR
jgi:four helix bundle protein